MNTNIKDYNSFKQAYKKANARDRYLLTLAHPLMATRLSAEFYSGVSGAKEKGQQQIEAAQNKVVRRNTNKALAGQTNSMFAPINKQVVQPRANNNIQQIIIDEANRQGVNPQLALAVAKQESGFNPNARGDGGKSFGLFQIHSISHPDYKGGLDPQANARYGIGLLKNLLNQYGGNVEKALWAYNAGSGNVAKGIYPESTKRYTRNIMSMMGQNITSGTPIINYSPQDIQSNYYTPSYQPNAYSTLKQIYSRQNAQQGGLNIPQVNLYSGDNQQPLRYDVKASDYFIDNPARAYNISANMLLEDLYNRTGQGRQPIQEQGQQTMINNPNDMPQLRGYADVMQAQKAPVPQNINNDILNQYMAVMNSINTNKQNNYKAMYDMYQNAANKDAMINETNALVNSLTAGTNKAPIYYVGANGNLNAIQLDQPNNAALLPTDTNYNTNAVANKMALMQQAQKDKTDYLGQIQNLQTAQAYADRFGGTPELYLNADNRKDILQYILNPEISQQAQFKRERNLIPFTTEGKLAELRQQGANSLGIENLKGRYQLSDTELENKMKGTNQQAYVNAMLGGQITRDQLNNLSEAARADARNQTLLELARINGANAQELAIVNDELYSNNPVRGMQAAGSLLSPLASLGYMGGTPEQSNKAMRDAFGVLNQYFPNIPGINTMPVTPQDYENSLWDRL